VIALVLLLLATSTAAAAEPGCPERPLVIAHRGASGDAPEHTMAAYELAILQGADVLEPDLVMTKDGVLVARHENEFGETSDVAQRPEFASRRTTRSLDGWEMTGWFVEDFTWSELRTVRARERIPDIRPANTRFDGMFPIVTFRELLERVAIENRRREAWVLEAQGYLNHPLREAHAKIGRAHV
jgi:glycerophosphoryl diester phosphodiesterase